MNSSGNKASVRKKDAEDVPVDDRTRKTGTLGRREPSGVSQGKQESGRKPYEV